MFIKLILTIHLSLGGSITIESHLPGLLRANPAITTGLDCEAEAKALFERTKNVVDYKNKDVFVEYTCTQEGEI